MSFSIRSPQWPWLNKRAHFDFFRFTKCCRFVHLIKQLRRRVSTFSRLSIVGDTVFGTEFYYRQRVGIQLDSGQVRDVRVRSRWDWCLLPLWLSYLSFWRKSMVGQFVIHRCQVGCCTLWWLGQPCLKNSIRLVNGKCGTSNRCCVINQHSN